MKLSFTSLLVLFYHLPPHNAFISTTSLCSNIRNCAHELILSQNNRHHNNLLQSKQRCSKPSTFIFARTTTQLSSTNLDVGRGGTSRGRGRGGGRGGRGRGRRGGRARGGNGRFGDYNSSSQQRGGRNRDPDMRNCKSIEELIDMAYAHKDMISPRGMSAFWTLTSRFLQRRGGPTPKHEQMQMQIDQLIGQTLQSIHKYGYRDISTVAISLAKIMKKVDENGHSKGSPHSILRDVLIGCYNSDNKQFIFNEIACASVPILYEFDARSLSNLIYAFGLAEVIIPVENGGTFFDSLAEVAIPLLYQFNSYDLSNMLWAYGNMKIPKSQLFHKSAETIFELDLLKAFNSQDISNMLWAFATLEESHPKLFKRLADHIVGLGNLNDFKPQNISNFLWAYATTGESHSKLFQKIADHIVRLNDLRDFWPHALSNILWAYATAKESHPKLFKKVGNHIVALDNLDRFNEQALSNTVWAYATVKESHQELFKKVGNHIVTLDHLYRFNGQDCSNTVWAYASAGESHPELFKKLADHIVTLDNLDEFIPQNLSNTVWAFATAKESHPTLFQKLSDAAITRQNEFNSQGIANFLWAYTTNGQIDKNLFSSLVPTVEANLSKCNVQGLSNIAWAYTVANVDAPSLFNGEFINACLQNEDDFEWEGLSQLHQWQLWQEEIKSRASLPPSLQKKCCDTFISRVPEPSKLQDDVISQLSSLGLQLEEEVLTKSGYRLDALVEMNRKKVGVEVDGPFHFLGTNPNGSTILKHRQVTNLDGIPVVSVPYWEWNKLKKDSEKKQQYLRSLLNTSLGRYSISQ